VQAPECCEEGKEGDHRCYRGTDSSAMSDPHAHKGSLRLHGLTRLGQAPAPLDTHVRVPTQPKGEPAQHIPEQRDAQDTRLEDGIVQVVADRVEVFDDVADVGGSSKGAPGNEGDDCPVARCESARDRAGTE
jgi:hypothetical protein